MNNKQIETIAAIATARGYGGVGIVRLSGPLAKEIGKIITGKDLPSRYAVYTDFLAQDGTTIDRGIALFFPDPNSFTGEDVLELHGHGGPVVMDCLLQQAVNLGAVLAKPGEFSERAFLNNKLDLIQVEAVASLIEAQTVAAAKGAMRSLQGDFSKAVHAITDQLIELRQYIEASIDFPEEELDLLSEAKVGDSVKNLQARLAKLLQQTQQGVLLGDGVKVVIVGPVNAGKSSLLNLLTGTDAAIVTAIPGTTRDLVGGSTLLDGIKLELIDTAGLRQTTDVIEQQGVRRALSAVERAEIILLVIDANVIKNFSVRQMFPELWKKVENGVKLIVVYNKIDLLKQQAAVVEQEGLSVVKLSAQTGAGKELLLQQLKRQTGWVGTENVFLARRRHLLAIEQAQQHMQLSVVTWQQYGNGELFAEELRSAQRFLGEVTGEFSSEDLLTKIFSEFCIGK